MIHGHSGMFCIWNILQNMRHYFAKVEFYEIMKGRLEMGVNAGRIEATIQTTGRGFLEISNFLLFKLPNRRRKEKSPKKSKKQKRGDTYWKKS